AYRIALDAGPTALAQASGEHQQRDNLLLAQIHTLYNSSWLTTAGALITALTFWGGYLYYSGDAKVLIWALMVHGTQAARGVAGWLYHRDEEAWTRMAV